MWVARPIGRSIPHGLPSLFTPAPSLYRVGAPSECFPPQLQPHRFRFSLLWMHAPSLLAPLCEWFVSPCFWSPLIYFEVLRYFFVSLSPFNGTLPCTFVDALILHPSYSFLTPCLRASCARPLTPLPQMKLYLRRDVAGYSYKRWGNEEGLAAEKHRRDSLKYDRTLARTQVGENGRRSKSRRAFRMSDEAVES